MACMRMSSVPHPLHLLDHIVELHDVVACCCLQSCCLLCTVACQAVSCAQLQVQIERSFESHLAPLRRLCQDDLQQGPAHSLASTFGTR